MLMSELGPQKQTSGRELSRSAVPPKADIHRHDGLSALCHDLIELFQLVVGAFASGRRATKILRYTPAPFHAFDMRGIEEFETAKFHERNVPAG